jgi:hypothetical protein
MANKFVVISNSYGTLGTGSSFQPYTFQQFLDRLSATAMYSDNYFISGTRELTNNLTITTSGATVSMSAWGGEEPYTIIGRFDVYFNIGSTTLSIYDMRLDCVLTNLTETLFDSVHDNSKTQDLIIDNCHIRLSGSDLGFEDLRNVSLRNSTIAAKKITGQYVSSIFLVNDIIDVDDIDATVANNVDSLSVDNCVFSADSDSFTSDNTDWTNIQNSWNSPAILNSAVSALNAASVNYLSADFNGITVSGNTSYTNTWYGGVRDGIGALYFPSISGVSISASLTSAATGTLLQFVLSGNDPFTNFSASSATYNFADGFTSAINSNSVLTHSFSSTDAYIIFNTIRSKNGWSNVNTALKTILIGGFTVTISIYDVFGNTRSVSRPLSQLTYSATTNGYNFIDSYLWDFGDSLTGSGEIDTNEYIGLGTKSISVTAYGVESSFSAIGNTTVGISALTSAYFVYISSAYDTTATHTGTSANPYSWDEFKVRVEGISADYSDTYYLSGSRKLVQPTVGQNVLAINPLKNLTIDAWGASDPIWCLEVEDWATTDTNSIFSAVGTTLKNGIIYNKGFSLPIHGGTLKLTNTKDMFVVYQGEFAGIEINPFNNVLYCGGYCAVVIASASSTITGSTIYLSGNGYTDTFNTHTYSAMNVFVSPGSQPTTYRLSLVDSVLTGLVRENNSYFCNARVDILNDTFNKSYSAISGDFTISANDDCQFDWVAPVEYPFTQYHRLYDKEIDYIIQKKGDLKPFDDIELPPNPGYGASAYDGYEAGLFGNLRGTYSTSGV